MKHHILYISVGAFIGAVCGWFYWSTIGCTTGGCAITAHPLNSTLYGALVGGLLGSTIHAFLHKNNPNEQQQ